MVPPPPPLPFFPVRTIRESLSSWEGRGETETPLFPPPFFPPLAQGNNGKTLSGAPAKGVSKKLSLVEELHPPPPLPRHKTVMGLFLPFGEVEVKSVANLFSIARKKEGLRFPVPFFPGGMIDPFTTQRRAPPRLMPPSFLIKQARG